MRGKGHAFRSRDLALQVDTVETGIGITGHSSFRPCSHVCVRPSVAVILEQFYAVRPVKAWLAGKLPFAENYQSSGNSFASLWPLGRFP